MCAPTPSVSAFLVAAVAATVALARGVTAAAAPLRSVRTSCAVLSAVPAAAPATATSTPPTAWLAAPATPDTAAPAVPAAPATAPFTRPTALLAVLAAPDTASPTALNAVPSGLCQTSVSEAGAAWNTSVLLLLAVVFAAKDDGRLKGAAGGSASRAGVTSVTGTRVTPLRMLLKAATCRASGGAGADVLLRLEVAAKLTEDGSTGSANVPSVLTGEAASCPCHELEKLEIGMAAPASGDRLLLELCSHHRASTSGERAAASTHDTE